MQRVFNLFRTKGLCCCCLPEAPSLGWTESFQLLPINDLYGANGQ